MFRRCGGERGAMKIVVTESFRQDIRLIISASTDTGAQ
jgi:hypothetical protein